MLKIILMFIINFLYAEYQTTVQYEYKGRKLTFSTNETDFNKVIELGADQCYVTFKHLVKTEEDKLDLIDVCVNPRKVQK